MYNRTEKGGLLIMAALNTLYRVTGSSVGAPQVLSLLFLLILNP